MCVSPHAAIFVESFKPGTKWQLSRFESVAFQDEIQEQMDKAVANIKAGGRDAKWTMIACGQCHECRLQRSREWANRCVMEMDAFPPENGIVKNWFVTLTYAPEHTDALRSTVDGQTLSLHQPSSGKDHLQMFNNAVRKKWDEKFGHEGVRFYGCGEYGDESARPHYHEILFNLPLQPDQLKLEFTNQFGDKYFSCPDLFGSWGEKGHVLVSEANWTNAAYVARYIMKKLNGDLGQKAYDDLGLKAPFTRQSRRPGIGASFYKGLEHYFDVRDLEYYIDPDTGELLSDLDQLVIDSQQDKDKKFQILDKCYLPCGSDKIDPVCKPPKYFDRLFERDYPQCHELIKKKREECLQRAQAQAKVLYPISDRELFKLRTDAWDKQQIGNHRKFLSEI